MRVGFIGLGNLGKAMVNRLAGEGIDLVAWNRTPGKANDVSIHIAKSPKDVAEQSDIIFINLFDSGAVEDVAQRGDGLLSSDLTGKIIIDTTTNHFEKAVYFHRMFSCDGAWYLEAPVLGSVVPASKGELTILVSGKREAYDSALPYLEKLGKTVFYLEEPGYATKMKLINNIVLGSLMATLAEALTFGEAVGVDKGTVLDILASGAGNSMVLNAKRAKLMDGEFSPQFSASLIYKDLHYAQDLAKALERPLFTGSTAQELFAMTFKKGLSDQDISVIYEILRQL